ncbi:MAG: lytic transglycosylase domain-containing protein, partial [Sphingomicrobium sp.]
MRWTPPSCRLIALLLVPVAAPALAQQDDPLAPVLVDAPLPPPPAPPPVAVPKDWRGVFAAIRAEQWAAAQAGIDALGAHPLNPVARAELMTARNSPKADLASIETLIAAAPELPQASQLQRMAIARGSIEPPRVVSEGRVVPLPAAPRRHRSRPVSGEPAAEALRLAMEPLVKVDSAVEAEALYTTAAPSLSPEARAEAAQRVAWIYYVLGQDAEAKRVAEAGISGASGDWAAQAQWIAGLASWRVNDCTNAAAHFRAVAISRAESELIAAGAYWAARSEMACRRPQLVEGLMKQAARSPESFYGLVARQTLGLDRKVAPGARAPASLSAVPNVRRAVELTAIGERALAETMLRHQARIGSPASHAGLAAKARELELVGAAFWIGHNGPPGSVTAAADRFPLPRWAPNAGWRVDPALAWAHVRQESDFRMAAVSPAGAVGLMQVRPGTAGDAARARGVALGNLADPATNLEYGQSFIELMRGKSATRGQLPRVIAA